MPEGFDTGAHALRPVAIQNVGGLLFLCLSENPPPIDRVKEDISSPDRTLSVGQAQNRSH
ncbi:hypothetical protein [Novosphingobium sp. CCH12-A3]|uniref:hypothetical protein n=1 Tax=Novosphingobium sp. CCH12-A3 TaxID=1768752 RepID=UPI001E5646FA|nr:hypothetical protein [Novosphingobium sp. CCH12-A3]